MKFNMSFRNSNPNSSSSTSSSMHQVPSSNSRHFGSRITSDSSSHHNNHQRFSPNEMSSPAKRDLLQRRAKDKNEEPEESPATPDSTTEPPKPAHDFQEGDDVFFHTDEGQNMLGTIGQVTPSRCQVLFGDGTQQWAPHRRLKKLSCAVDEPPPPRAPPPHAPPPRRRSSTSTNIRENSNHTIPQLSSSTRKNSSTSITSDTKATISSNSNTSISTSHHSHGHGHGHGRGHESQQNSSSKDKIEIICISCKSKKKLSARKAALLNSKTPFKCTKCHGFGIASPNPAPLLVPQIQSHGQGTSTSSNSNLNTSSLPRQLLKRVSSSNNNNNNSANVTTNLHSGTAQSSATSTSSSITSANQNQNQSQNSMSLSNFLKSSPMGTSSSLLYHQNQNQVQSSSGIIGSPDLTVSRIPGPPTPTSPAGSGGHGPMKPNRTSVSVPLTSPSPIKTGKTTNLCFHCGNRTCPYDRVHCNLCERYCHLMCLALSPQPLEGDKFWDVMCSACGTQTASPGGEQGMSRVFSVRRSITSWSDVVHLIINCLKAKSLGQIYFDFDSQIIPFFDNNIDRLHLPRQYKLASIEDRKSHLLSALTSSRFRFSNHKGSSSSEAKRAASLTLSSTTITSNTNSGATTALASSSTSATSSEGGTLWSIRSDDKKNDSSVLTPIAGGRPGSSSLGIGVGVGKNLFSTSISEQSSSSSPSFTQSDVSVSGSSSASTSYNLSDVSISPQNQNHNQPATNRHLNRSTFRLNQNQSGSSSALSIVPIANPGIKKQQDGPPVVSGSPRVLSKEALLRNPMTTNIILSPSKPPPATSIAPSQKHGISHSQNQRITRITVSEKEKEKSAAGSGPRQEVHSNSTLIHRQRLRVRLPLKPTGKKEDESLSSSGLAASSASSSSPSVLNQNQSENQNQGKSKIRSLTLSPIIGRAASRKRVISSDEEDSMEPLDSSLDSTNKDRIPNTITNAKMSSPLKKPLKPLIPQDKSQIEVSMGRAIKSARMDLSPELGKGKISSNLNSNSHLSLNHSHSQPPSNPRGRPKLLRSSVKSKLIAATTTGSGMDSNTNNSNSSTATATQVKANNSIAVKTGTGRGRGRPPNQASQTGTAQTTGSSGSGTASSVLLGSTGTSNSINNLFNEESLTNDTPSPSCSTSNNLNSFKNATANSAFGLNTSTERLNGGLFSFNNSSSSDTMKNSLNRISSLNSLLNNALPTRLKKIAHTPGQGANSESNFGRYSESGSYFGSGTGIVDPSSISLFSEASATSANQGDDPNLLVSDRASMTLFKTNLTNAALFGGLQYQCLPQGVEKGEEKTKIAEYLLLEEERERNGNGISSNGNSGENSSDDCESRRSENSNSNTNFNFNSGIFSHWNSSNSVISTGTGTGTGNGSGNGSNKRERPKRKSTLLNLNSNSNSENQNQNPNPSQCQIQNQNQGNSNASVNSIGILKSEETSCVPKKRNRFQKTLDDHDSYEIVGRKIDSDGIIRYQVVWKEPIPEGHLDFDEEIERLFFRHEEERAKRNPNSLRKPTKTEKNADEANEKHVSKMEIEKINLEANGKAFVNVNPNESSLDEVTSKLMVNGLTIKVEKDNDVGLPIQNQNQYKERDRNRLSCSSGNGSELGKGPGNGGPKFILGQGGIQSQGQSQNQGLIQAQNQSGFTSSCGSVSVSVVPCFIDLTTDSP